jgi:hypothetical protein
MVPQISIFPLQEGNTATMEAAMEVAYRWTHLILINVNLVQQDATIQDNGSGVLCPVHVEML